MNRRMRSTCGDGRSNTIGVPGARTLGIAAPIGIGRDTTQECYQAGGIAEAAAAAGAIASRRRCSKAAPSCTQALLAFLAHGSRPSCDCARLPARPIARACRRDRLRAPAGATDCARLPARLARGVAHIARLSKSDALQGAIRAQTVFSSGGRNRRLRAAGRPPLARIRTPVWRPFCIDTVGGTCHRCSGQASGSPIRRGCSPCHPLTHGEIK